MLNNFFKFKKSNKPVKDDNIKIISVASGALAGGTAAIGGTIAGGAIGTAGGAALTSGLAATGTILGGGMVAGMVVLSAAPIVGGAVGYGIYNLYKYLASNYRIVKT